MGKGYSPEQIVRKLREAEGKIAAGSTIGEVAREFATALKRHLAASGVRTLYIEPGAPWENAYAETFVSRLRDELLDRELFATLKEAKVLAEDYRKHYNHHRPHGVLGYLTPAEFADLHQLPLQQDPAGAGEETEKLQCVPVPPRDWCREWGPVIDAVGIERRQRE